MYSSNIEDKEILFKRKDIDEPVVNDLNGEKGSIDVGEKAQN